MNTTTITAELPRARRRIPVWPRLVSAELLKVRKRRGLVISALVLTVAPMLIAYAVLVSLHVSDPSKHGPAGGTENFVGSMGVLWGLSVVAAILVGATIGTSDLGAGVFRELVVTGRSRLALFAARVPAGLALLLPIVGVAFAVNAAASTLLAGSKEGGVVQVGPGAWEKSLGSVAPSGSLLLESAGWLALVTALTFLLALGIASLLGSRGTSIGILLGWWLVAMPLLLSLEPLGSVRKGLSWAAVERLAPDAVMEPVVPMSLAAAVVVLLAWTAAPLAVGAWRTCTRDA
jgi:hypothetical protein